jgi:hypothetical protein
MEPLISNSDWVKKTPSVNLVHYYLQRNILWDYGVAPQTFMISKNWLLEGSLEKVANVISTATFFISDIRLIYFK